MAGLTSLDITELLGYLLGSFGIGIASALILRVFRKSGETIR